MPAQRRKLRISLIGAGNVGTALAIALRKRGHSIVSVVSHRRSSARRCARLVACRNYSTDLFSLPRRQDLILITVPDESVKSIALQLWRLDQDYEGVFVAHTSGVLSSEVLRPVESRGARTFSLHPIQTFPGKGSVEDHVRSLGGISYGFEGPSAEFPFARRLVRDLDGRVLFIPKEAKILYHIACVFASNYPVALMSVVESLTTPFLNRRGLGHFKKLVETSIANAMVGSPQRALTGPIARGSIQTIRMHLAELRKNKNEIIPLYRELALLALRLSSKSLDPRTSKEIRKALSQYRGKLSLRKAL